MKTGVFDDDTLHTVHARRDGATYFNLATPARGTHVSRTLTEPGIFRISCDVGHVWTTAWLLVFPHPYFAVSDATGHFRISGLPDGTYAAHTWHERLGTRTASVVVRGGTAAPLKIEY